MVCLRLAFCDFELLLLTREQIVNHPPLSRVGFPGKQVFEMGDVGPRNEPVHDSPSIVDKTHCLQTIPNYLGIPPMLVHICRSHLLNRCRSVEFGRQQVPTHLLHSASRLKHEPRVKLT